MASTLLHSRSSDAAPAPPPAVIAAPSGITIRTATADDATTVHALIEAHATEAHLLRRSLVSIERRSSRFVVASRGADIVGAAELAPLSARVAEVRSLVVREDARHEGVGRRIVAEISQRARRDGFDTLAAFAHRPGFFVRLGFSMVPHQWLPEKIHVDCQSCALFRSCGQQAVVLSLTSRGRAGRRWSM